MLKILRNRALKKNSATFWPHTRISNFMLLLDFSAKLSASLQRDSMGSLEYWPYRVRRFHFRFCSWCYHNCRCPFCCWRPCCDWHPFRFQLQCSCVAFWCCWGPAVVDIPSVPGVSTVVCVHFVVGVPTVWLASLLFTFDAVVGVAAVVEIPL